MNTRTLLRLDASARTTGSHSRMLADDFTRRWRSLHPAGRVIARCLATDPIPHLDDATIRAFHHGTDAPGSRLSDTLIAELSAADDLLISTPIYNFATPSPLKAWIDHVVRFGRTVASDPSAGYKGMLGGKSATVIVALGGQGTATDAGIDETGALRRALAFIGIAPVEEILIEGTAQPGPALDAALAAARHRIDALLTSDLPPVWSGTHTEEDRRAIESLRLGQEIAIRTGDADSYAALCADDVCLMVPGHDIVEGRDQLHACELALFRAGSFPGFCKRPERVLCAGDLAVETGRQSVTASRGAEATGVSAPQQKYTHVFRRTAQGWRFAVLMSNNSR